MLNSRTIGQALTIGAGMALLAAALPLTASAQAKPGNRVDRQQQRLQQGLKSGQLTKGEYNRDQARLNQINAQRQADLAANGGHLSAAEHSRLESELNHNSRSIYFNKHNLNGQDGAKGVGKTQLPGLPGRSAPGYVGDRVNRQMDRIRNGVANGSITRAEYGEDMKGLSAINSQRDAWLKAQGGTLTDAQKSQLNAELNHEYDQIKATRHNTQQQPGA